MTSVSQESFEETSNLMTDLMKVFQVQDDSDAILALQAKHNDVLRLCEEREEKMDALLEDLVKKVNEAKRKAAPAVPEKSHRQEVLEADQNKERTAQQIDDMAAEAKLEAYQEDLQDSANALQRRRVQLENLARQELPRVVYELSLYANISGIAWDLNTPNEVKGNITRRREGDVQPFIIKEASEFELSNRLWELIS